ncbi:ChbG/HpnK family deacetylase [Labrenzia sp. CE80]|uniref:ChbG/HpnK family deacetylase n=1 Tax=Labrenzia sp. CE80 TaxID=1788986 RepID=UPI00129B93C1|nr:ChbG/HpnK family deacetylase [Labrenzia sp. CE80]
MPSDIRLLVRADDAGSSLSSNFGCLEACVEGIARSVEVMMPCSWVTHAASLFNARPEIDVGIHLTLTSEWDSVKWRPLTPAKSLTDKHGNFLPLVLPREYDSRRCLADADWSLDEIASEFKAQVSLGVAMFRGVSHVSSHMLKHFKDLDPKIGEVIADICDDFGLADDAFGNGLPRIEGYPKYPRDAESRIAAFKQQVSVLSPGTYIFIDHPAIETAELAATGHEGYQDVAADRISCLQTLTSDALKQHLDDVGVDLISYRDL